MIATVEERIAELETEVRRLNTRVKRCVRTTTVKAGEYPEPTEGIRVGDLSFQGENSGFIPRIWRGNGFQRLSGMPGTVGTIQLENLSVTTAKLADDSATAAKINADVAGDGLGQAGDGSLEVNPGTGLEIVADALRIAAAAAGNGLLGGGGIALSVNTDGTVTTIIGDQITLMPLGVLNDHVALNTLTETRRVVAVTEAPSAINTILNHASARIIRVDMTGGARTCTVENGTFAGQLLKIMVVAGGAADILMLDNADANLDLIGDWVVAANLGVPTITLCWSGTAWQEAGSRKVALGDNIDAIYAMGIGGQHDIGANADASLAIGVNNTITDDYSLASGEGNTLGGIRSAALGARCTGLTTADVCLIHGHYALARWYAAHAHGAGRFGALGDAQGVWMVLRVATDGSDDSFHTMTSPDTLDTENDKTYAVFAYIVGCTVDGVKGACYARQGLFKNAGGVLTLVGESEIGTDIESDATWDVQFAVTSPNILLQVKDDNEGATVRWVAHVHLVEVLFT